MTDDELEARARRAYEDHSNHPTGRYIPWADWLAIARAVLEEPPADPFEEWIRTHPVVHVIGVIGGVTKERLRETWNAGAAHEREECAKMAEGILPLLRNNEITPFQFTECIRQGVERKPTNAPTPLDSQPQIG